MTIFSLELNKDFKISNTKGQRIYFHEKNFLELCKNNSLKISKDELSSYNLENKLINPLPVHRYSKEELCSYIETKYHLNNLKEEKTLYPEWLLFYIAAQKYSSCYIKGEFEKYISFFEKIAEIRHKNYIKNNPKNFINTFNNYDELLETLNVSFDKFIRPLVKKLNKEELFNFLVFLWKFHSELKNLEKYKLMWNLETYIIECMNLLTDKKIDFQHIYTHHKKLVKCRSNKSPLHEIQINLPLYIKENHFHFDNNPNNGPTILDKINICLEKSISADELIEVFTANDKIQNLVFSRLEIDRFYDSNKFNEFVMKSLIKNFVLEIESLIIDKVPKNQDGLFDNIKQFKKGSCRFSEYRGQVAITTNTSWSELSQKINNIKNDNKDYKNKLIRIIEEYNDISQIQEKVNNLNESVKLDKKDNILKQKINFYINKLKPENKSEIKKDIISLIENSPIEKHLMIYYHFRNYFAHNHVNVDELIWSESGEYIRTILESAIITIYFVATFKK
ncbi:hypothetical protein [Francisella sp. LA112445]|uniref:hypothetical protein n=1 Tax=Francisella sp. LA112445 TaxID=1395624 RepID=UPI001788CBB3|nr:hypothetical protein [Francisella sp. LA112445]QIW10684.1 hypothetical protein FIP56_08205 [Francisella sp. LA112445]